MGRRRKGRNISGWLIVDKPQGPSSNDVVGRVRRALDARKAGHAGTLDPMATGLLAVALGEATKTVPFVTDADKGYRFTVRFGQATDTDDAEGRIVATSDDRPTDAAIAAALAQFRGDILQVPPQYSAVKIDGARAYAVARAGDTAKIAARPLHVARLEMIERPNTDHAVFEMTCGKGGYVRSIARDLGQALGCLGHVTVLRRLWSGPFSVDAGAVTLEALEASDDPDSLLLPLEASLTDLPRMTCSAEAAVRLRNGNPAQVITSEADFGEVGWAAHQGKAIAIGTYKAGMLHPNRVILP